MPIDATFILRGGNDATDAFGHVEGTKAAAIHSERPVTTRRRFTGILATAVLLPWATRAVADSWMDPVIPEALPARKYPLFEEATANVLPAAGYPSRIALNDSIVRLVRRGALETMPDLIPKAGESASCGVSAHSAVLYRG